LAGPVGDSIGRRGAFFGAIFFLTIGTLLQLSIAGNLALLGIGRALLGVGVGMLANATPLYLSEVSNTAIRGAVVGSWQLLLAIGQVIGAVVGQGTHDLETTAAYRIPIGVNLIFALVLLVSQFIIPESPRWFVSKGRNEEAKASLMRINKDQDDPDLVVALQYQAFMQAHQEEVEMMTASGWKSLLQGVEARKLMIVCGILTAQQIGGVQFIFSYTTTFFASSGISDSFKATIIVDLIEVVGVLCSFFVVNRFGRRQLLIWASVPMAISLFMCGALGSDPNGLPETATQSRLLVAMVCIYVFFFNLAWGPVAWVIATECATGRNRQKLMSLGSATFFLWAFIVAFTLPYLFDADEGNLGSQIGDIYGVGTLVALVFVYLCIPETLGRSLEGE
jgi:SP family sugar:H+ symporter-like MFS transporter